jgi:hypothetical protein
MHRAAGGSFEGKYVRDLRRTTVHDASSTAWGLNEEVDTRPGFNSNGTIFLCRRLSLSIDADLIAGKEQISLGEKYGLGE